MYMTSFLFCLTQGGQINLDSVATLNLSDLTWDEYQQTFLKLDKQAGRAE